MRFMANPYFNGFFLSFQRFPKYTDIYGMSSVFPGLWLSPISLKRQVFSVISPRSQKLCSNPFTLIERIPRSLLRGRKPLSALSRHLPPTNGIPQSHVLVQLPLPPSGERDRGLGGLSRIPRCLRRGSSLYRFRAKLRIEFSERFHGIS